MQISAANCPIFEDEPNVEKVSHRADRFYELFGTFLWKNATPKSHKVNETLCYHQGQPAAVWSPRVGRKNWWWWLSKFWISLFFLRLYQLWILFARKFEEMEPVLYANRFLWLVEILGALLRVGYWFWWNGRLQELVLLKTAIFSFEIFRQHNDTTFDDHERRFFFMEIGNNEVW